MRICIPSGALVIALILWTACNEVEEHAAPKSPLLAVPQFGGEPLPRVVFAAIAQTGDTVGDVVFDLATFENDRTAGLKRQLQDPKQAWQTPAGFRWMPRYPRPYEAIGEQELTQLIEQYRYDLKTKPWEADGLWILLDPIIKKELGRGYFDRSDFGEVRKIRDFSGGNALSIQVKKERHKLMESYTAIIVDSGVCLILGGQVVFEANVRGGTFSGKIEISQGGEGYTEEEQAQILEYF